jgi:hypothetical protein
MAKSERAEVTVADWVVLEFGKVWGFVDNRIQMAFLRATVLKFIVTHSLTLTADEIESLTVKARAVLAFRQLAIEE